MEKPPAFQFYPKDILTDGLCVAMTDEEFGVYVRLICYSWLEGSLPADPVRLQRITKRNARSFGRVWPAIAPCFEEREGRLYQRRLEREREKQARFRDGQSRRARKIVQTSTNQSADDDSSAGQQPTKSNKPNRINKTNKPSRSRQRAGEKPSPSPPFPSSSPEVTDNGLAPAPPPPTATNWNRDAADDFTAVYGSAPPKLFFAHVLPVARKYGWNRTRPALKAYMSETPIEFLNVAKCLAAKVEGVGPVRARGQPNGRTPTAADLTRTAVQEVLDEEEARRDRQSGFREGPGGIGSATAAVVGSEHVGRLLPRPPDGDG